MDLYFFSDDVTVSTPVPCFVDHTLLCGAEPEECITVATGGTMLNFLGAQACAFTGTSVHFAVEAGPLNRDGAGYIILVW